MRGSGYQFFIVHSLMACGVASHLNGRRNHRAYRLLIKFSVTPESRSAVALALLLDMCKNTNDLTNIHDLS